METFYRLLKEQQKNRGRLILATLRREQKKIMNALQRFSYNGSNVRTVQKDGETWFVGKDVAQVLGYSDVNKAVAMHVDEEDKLNDKTALSVANSRMVASRLDADEKGACRIDTLGGTQEMTCINESGLYSVLFRSDKPEAKPLGYATPQKALFDHCRYVLKRNTPANGSQQDAHCQYGTKHTVPKTNTPS